MACPALPRLLLCAIVAVALAVALAAPVRGEKLDTHEVVVYSQVHELVGAEGEAKRAEWAHRLPIPDTMDIAVTAWLWELEDADTGEVVELTREMYMHHSGVHGMPEAEAVPEDADGARAIMQRAVHLHGFTDMYNTPQRIPPPYSVQHRVGDDPWYMCGHILNAAVIRRVRQKLTLWFHEATADDVRVGFLYAGASTLAHPFRHVALENRTYVCRMPMGQSVSTVGYTIHGHMGLLRGAVRDAITGEEVLRHEIGEHSEFRLGVLHMPYVVLERPRRWLASQFFYVDFEMDVRVADNGGPMQVMILMTMWDDPTAVRREHSWTNPDSMACTASMTGIDACRPFVLDDLLHPREGPPAQEDPGPLLRACTEDGQCNQVDIARDVRDLRHHRTLSH